MPSSRSTSARSSSSPRFIVGIDLGGTNMVGGVLSEDGSRQLARRSIRTHAELGAAGVIARMVELAESVIADARASGGVERDQYLGVGIGAPGPLDRENGIVRIAPNLGWREVPVRQMVSDALRLPAELDNDANCATLGETWLGAARGARHVVGLTIGTGIGGGLVIDGRLFHGASDVAGEVGHTTIEAAGRRCGCGNLGCLEAYASGPAIAQRAREALDGSEASELWQLMDDDPASITAEAVYRAAQAGDSLARLIVRETAEYLGTGVANLLNVFNPELVVIAGGVTQAGDALFEPLRAAVRRRAFRPAVEACRIVPGTLPGTAGMVGAVAMFRSARLGLGLSRPEPAPDAAQRSKPHAPAASTA